MDRANYPGPHPEPPPNLSAYDLPLVSIDASWFRFYRCVYEPVFFGRTGTTRFDAPDQEFGTLYMSNDIYGAFIEVFGESRRTDGAYPSTNVVEISVLDQRCVCQISTTRLLKLVDLTGPGLAAIGADERLCAGDHAIAQRWARAFWLHPSHVDGLYYRARHDPSRYSAAVYDRAADVLHAHPQGTLLNDPTLLADILRTYRFALID